MALPIPNPEEKMYRRVLLISRLDGWSIAVVAALGLLLALVLGDLVGVLVGLLVLGCGLMEIRGYRQLQRRDSEGMRWLVRSQLCVLAVILTYCASRLGSFDSENALGNLTPDMAAMLQEAGIDTAEILPLVRMMFVAVYGGVAITTLLYQGGLTLYYRRRTARVTAFLAPPPVAPPPINYSVL